MRTARWINGERGSTIGMAILALTMVAMIMLFVGTQSMSSLFAARKKSDKTVGMAAGDSGVEKYRAALQSGLANEDHRFLLTRPMMERLRDGDPKAKVIPNNELPATFGLSPVSPRVGPNYQFTMAESGVGGGSTVGYWQVYDILQPRYMNNPPMSPSSNLVVYIRAWATSTGGTITTRPKIFRLEYRPGYFSDYQLVTDAPLILQDFPSLTINGPIHTNGYEYQRFMTRRVNGTYQPTGIYINDLDACGTRARFTASRNAPINVPNNSGCKDAPQDRNARPISLLNIEEAFASMTRRCADGTRPVAVVRCITNAAPYNVRLAAGGVRVNGQWFPLQPTSPDSRSLALLFDGDVVLSGSVSSGAPNQVARVTIATRRRNANDRRPTVSLRNTGQATVGAADARNSVGVMTQGDVVMNGRTSGHQCLRNVNLAVTSSAGSFVFDPQFITVAPPPRSLDNLDCGAINLRGSFAAHGQWMTSLNWQNPTNPNLNTPVVGYGSPTLAYNQNLFINPPPFFPTTTPWAVAKSKDANTSCLVPPNAGDPRCE